MWWNTFLYFTTVWVGFESGGNKYIFNNSKARTKFEEKT